MSAADYDGHYSDFRSVNDEPVRITLDVQRRELIVQGADRVFEFRWTLVGLRLVAKPGERGGKFVFRHTLHGQATVTFRSSVLGAQIFNLMPCCESPWP